MFLKCFWLLRKPSDQKYFYWWTVRLHLIFYVHKNLKINLLINLYGCMERFKRSKMWTCGELYENLQIFVDLHSVSKVFKALRRLPKRLKNLEVDTHKNSNVPQMLFEAFEETDFHDQKNIFIENLERCRSTVLNFYVQRLKIWRVEDMHQMFLKCF